MMRTNTLISRPPALAYLPLLLTSIVVALVVSACGDDADDRDNSPPGDDPGAGTEAPTGTPGDIDAPAPTGELLGNLPQHYPSDFPLYPEATVAGVARFADQVRVNLETTDARDTVVDFYRRVIREAPWEPLAEGDDAGRGQLVIRFRHTEESTWGQATIFSGDLTQISLAFTVAETVGETLPSASPVGQ